MIKIITITMLLFTLAGCATSEVQRIARQNDEHVYSLWTNKQGVQYVTRECPTIAPPVMDANGVAGPWTPTGIICVDVPGTCEAVRIPMDRKPQGVAGDDSMHMTEECVGPFYFRRAGGQQATR
jgi:hypothetical protein